MESVHTEIGRAKDLLRALKTGVNPIYESSAQKGQLELVLKRVGTEDFVAALEFAIETIESFVSDLNNGIYNSEDNLRLIIERKAEGLLSKYPELSNGVINPLIESFNEFVYSLIPGNEFDFESLPVLSISIINNIEVWYIGLSIFLERLDTDIENIRKDFFPKDGNVLVNSVDVLESDAHEYFGEVLKINFSNDQSIVYKNKSSGAKKIVEAYIKSYLSASTVKVPKHLYTSENYYWEECILEGEFEGTREFMAVSLGKLLGLCTVLQIEDFHAENVIVAKDGVYLIDLEFFYSPILQNQSNIDFVDNALINQDWFYSVSHPMIIPDLLHNFNSAFEDSSLARSVLVQLDNKDIENLVIGYVQFQKSISKKENEELEKIHDILIDGPNTRLLYRPTQFYIELNRKAFDNGRSKSLNSYITYIVYQILKNGSDFGPINKSEIDYCLFSRIPKLTCVEEEELSLRLTRFDNLKQFWTVDSFHNKQIEIIRNTNYPDEFHSIIYCKSSDEIRGFLEISNGIAKRIAFMILNYSYEPNRAKFERLGFNSGLLGTLYFLYESNAISSEIDVSRAIISIQEYLKTNYREGITDAFLSADEVRLFQKLTDNNEAGGETIHIDLRMRVTSKLALSITEKDSNDENNHDDLKNGLMGQVFRQLVLDRKANFDELTSRVRQLLIRRKRTGFNLKSNNIDLGVMNGYSGIGLSLLMLQNGIKTATKSEKKRL